MRLKSLYPINIKLVRDRQSLVHEVFEEVRPHKGNLIDVVILESYELFDVGSLFDTLKIGEKLSVERRSQKYRDLLVALREDQTVLGEISFKDAILMNSLIDLGLELFGFIEAFEFNAGMPEVAISVYCEDY